MNQTTHTSLYKIVPIKSKKQSSIETLLRLRKEVTKKWKGPGAVEEIRAQRTKTW